MGDVALDDTSRLVGRRAHEWVVEQEPPAVDFDEPSIDRRQEALRRLLPAIDYCICSEDLTQRVAVVG